MAYSCISVRGARVHNLKGIDVDIPHGTLTVVTGLSGSGKSSLAFDTLYAEGQRRYVETFSPYTRQFLDRIDKPQADSIEGIPPAIAIEQANAVRTSRSTVGTMTEVADHLKLLFPRLARPDCPTCGRPIRAWTAREIVADAAGVFPDGECLVLFPIAFPKGTPRGEAAAFLGAQGFLRTWEKGEVVRLDEGDPKAAVPEELLVVQDRVRTKETARLAEAVENALRYGKEEVRLRSPSGGEEHRYNRKAVCPHDGATVPDATPALFSFNHPTGACPLCRGFGRTVEIDYERALPDRSLTIRQGVVRAFQGDTMAESQRDLLRACKKNDIPIDVPFARLSEKDRRFVLDGEIPADADPEESYGQGLWYGVKGFFRWLESKSYKMHVRVLLSRYRDYRTCPACHGARLRPEALLYRMPCPDGVRRNVAEINLLPLDASFTLFSTLAIADADEPTERLRREIVLRLGYLRDVGLGYLTLDRATRTLSGGEIARVNLTSCLGNDLVNTLFVLDEPTIGLHPRDTGKLLGIVERLRDRGNTVLLVEHDEAVMRRADWLVDLGPGRGEQGGTVLHSGPLGDLKGDGASLTGKYLHGKTSVPLPKERRKPKPGQALRLEGARANNLDGLDLDLPLGLLVAITGVSGSGKSTLVHEVLHDTLALAERTAREQGETPEEASSPTLRKLTGHTALGEILRVDQSPLTRTSRSNPALYLGIWGPIRELLGQTEEAAAQGLTAGAFSFNGGMGRCLRCGGSGSEKVEMQFLADVFITCPVCDGKRFQPHVLKISYRGRNVDQILAMTALDARDFFRTTDDLDAFHRSRHEAIIPILSLLADVGLGYLRLGQPLSHLSGGEAQRIKLVSHLSGAGGEEEEETKPKKGKEKEKAGSRLFILDEPTTGLHFDDVRLLLALLQRIVDRGDSVFVIEHNLDVIATADWVVELGPEAGAGGGKLVAEGTPEAVARGTSATAPYLADRLAGRRTKLAAPQGAKKARRESGATGDIVIENARHHNLRNVSTTIERGKMTVVTGLSGSGKSTLAFDLLFAEGQRRYLDSLNAYARQFVDQMEKPAVDAVRGLPPAVAIEQRLTRGGGKSTVATITEIHQFLRLLYAKLGVVHDPETGEAAVRQSPGELLARLDAQLAKSGELTVLAPLIKARKGIHTEIAKWAEKKGYPYLRVDGKWIEPAKFKALDRFTEHTIDAVLGNLSRKQPEAERRRLVETALLLGRETFYVIDNRSRQTVHSTALYCPGTGRAFEEPDPRLFSFNSPHGWCVACQGYGTLADLPASALDDEAGELARELAIEAARDRAEEEADGAEESTTRPCPACDGGRLNPLARAVRLPLGKLAVDGAKVDPTLPDLGRLTVGAAAAWFAVLRTKLKGRAAAIGRDIVPEIAQRLLFLEEVGLGYLTLDRSATTLSGGESQRIRLAAQLGSNLQGVLYVLDEPTIGLHPKDNERLLDSLDALKAKGNTLVVVEHDEETMRRADRILDLGPGAGREGGKIVAEGTWKQLAADPKSVTGMALAHPPQHPIRGSRRPCGRKETGWLQVVGAKANNLKGIDAALPLGRLIVLCGPSGAGKSTLLHEVVKPALQAALAQKGAKKGKAVADPRWKKLVGAEAISSLCEIDASPIGKTPRSTPATYLGLMDGLRNLFAATPLSRQRGYTAARFSFNSGNGRCETCQGQGSVKVEMPFLPTVHIPCEACGGKRYKAETLDVLFNGKNISEVLNMGIDEASSFLEGVPRLKRPLDLLRQTGLGYLTLGQPSPTLSGGEAQRLKLIAQLAASLEGALQTRLRSRSPVAARQLFLLEEPTIGLHPADVGRLLDLLQSLVDAGHTVVVIEHHLGVIAEADHVLELGPGAGAAGGKIIFTGTPEELAKLPEAKSVTGPFVKSELEAGWKAKAKAGAAKKRGAV
ncbi:excinuclease ABC subunit UvrA [Verrucomicrobium sp. GAS474]|uniref:excinuclease ABC subunit UvrA n=1 Tax=Verrucomicrobium sp. GAS474 TaxID=1882831 RepID=UPI000B80E753|nr:excinuclease ABC subunit UvrA [Verrucomicrobium sp. GAS474]